jgi:hypothetical protein
MSGNAQGAKMFSKYLSIPEVAVSHVWLGGAYFGNTSLKGELILGMPRSTVSPYSWALTLTPNNLRANLNVLCSFMCLSFALNIALFILESWLLQLAQVSYYYRRFHYIISTDLQHPELFPNSSFFFSLYGLSPQVGMHLKLLLLLTVNYNIIVSK